MTESQIERDDYLDYRKSAIQGANEEIGKFDRYLLTLAAGAIALSLTYWDKIAGTGTPIKSEFLFGSWSFFALSLLSVLISHYCAFRSYHHDLNEIDQQYEHGEKYEWRTNRWVKATKKINVASLILFALGTLCLMVFAYSNLGEKPEMPRETRPSNISYVQNGQISVSPPKPQTKPTASTTTGKPTSKGNTTRS